MFEVDDGFAMKIRQGLFDKEHYERVKSKFEAVAHSIVDNNDVDKEIVAIVGLANNLYQQMYLNLSSEGNEQLDEIMEDLALYL